MGGDKGEGELNERSPPPFPSPIKGEGEVEGNMKFEIL